ncbi:DUF7344 domain-containing protein [Natronorubrum thiooxidans]|uniref:DUF7344 domain-containing protein n=1 Tax=Natronorubrum thiooxidans TaxID=308853 RepID=A0A1N7CS86_9EURY|nr:hypothetical protein [Natronorubrum thiooxidans]SIR66538.1 hypothetical protein SAMN05421752_101555 [Natronorubrum thiooxidans]
MNTDITNVEAAGTNAGLPSDTVFELLLEDRRRYALYYLSRKVGAVSLDELVARIAHREGTPTRDRREAIRLEFHHNHLRKLIEADVLKYDADAETVERKPAARALDSYLELAFVDDLR